MARRVEQSFFRSLPRADLCWISGGIALLFAPLWAVMTAEVVAPGRIPGFLTWCVFAGLTGMCWFLGGSYRRVFLIPAILLNIFVVVGGFYFETRASAVGGWFGPGTARPVPSLEGSLMLLMLVGAFVMIIRFISRVATPHMRMRTELRVASDIHAALVRPIDRTIGPITVAARSDPSSTMGGDLIDFIEHDDSVDVILADVTGHGVRAGVVMALAKGVFHAHLRPETPLADAVDRINADLCRLTEPAMFVTAAFVRVPKSDAGAAEAVVAGHPPLVRLRPSGDPARTDSTGLPLGIDPAGGYAAAPLDLRPGDRLILYSDGLTEAHNPDGSEFGIPALIRLLTATADQSPQAQLAAVLARIPADPARPADDRSLAIVALA